MFKLKQTDHHKPSCFFSISHCISCYPLCSNAETFHHTHFEGLFRSCSEEVKNTQSLFHTTSEYKHSEQSVIESFRVNGMQRELFIPQLSSYNWLILLSTMAIRYRFAAICLWEGCCDSTMLNRNYFLSQHYQQKIKQWPIFNLVVILWREEWDNSTQNTWLTKETTVGYN